MARTTMSDLIGVLRGMTNAGTSDYTAGTATYWTDNQLQETLDRYQYPVRDESMTIYPTQIAGGSVAWYDYRSAYRWYETTDGGTARFIIKDTIGTNIGTASWSAQYQQGRVTFGSDTGGTVYTVTGYAYDVYGAAAEVWRQKGAYYATAIDFSTDNHNIRRSHLLQNCERMAERYEAMSGTPYGESSNIATIYRGDQA